MTTLFLHDREAIRMSLSRPAPQPDPEDLHLKPIPAGARVTEAAVMVPVVHRRDALYVLFTQRTAHLADHAGQISFPGGRVEPEDLTREETALRETEEEIGLERSRVTLLGRLPLYEIPSGFRVTPVVGWVEPPFELRLDAFEVASVFEAPLAHFLDPARYERR
jgi:8-oxo-dGTP pyrophosphatase MutT (NUDIX family)